MNKPFLIFKKQPFLLKSLLILILILSVTQVYSFFTELRERSKFVPVDIKVVNVKFQSGYEERYFYDSYMDVYFDRDITDRDMELLSVRIQGEEVEINKLEGKVIRVIFKSEFIPKQEKHLKISYANSVFFEKFYLNEGLSEKETLENLPRSLNVE